MIRKIRLTESDMRRIVRKSVDRIMNEGNGAYIKKFSPASQDFVEEDEVLVTDKELFGDNEEHAYDMRCHDGWAEGTPSNNEEGLPARIRMEYPTLEDVLGDSKLTNYVLNYRGLHDLGAEDITYGDIMMALGEIDKTDEYKPEKKLPLTDLSKRVSGMIMPPKGYGIGESKEMKKNVIRLTEGDLKRIISESVRKVLREANLPEEGGLEYACHKATLSGEDDPEMGKIADAIYDKFSHNEMDVQEVIDAVLDYGVDYNDDEESVIPQSCHKLGTSGRYILTYESFTGTYDVWEKQ